MTWENLDKTRPDSAHYSIMRTTGNAMQALREMFPEGKADELNFVLFSTSGVHGTYNRIEECEAHILHGNQEDCSEDVTFLVVHPRIVALRYGNCHPRTPDDFAFLKKLRASSYVAMVSIGAAAAIAAGG